MNLEEILNERLHRQQIQDICTACSGVDNDSLKAQLFTLTENADDRISYNALWVFSHFSSADMMWLEPRRNILIDMVLHTAHTGKRRLILTLLEHLPTRSEDVRTDYLDYCLSGINSTQPYAVRALCMKQAFALCRHYPELTAELKNEIGLMEYGRLSPGLRSARRNVLRKIERLTGNADYRSKS